MKHIEAMKLALEALETAESFDIDADDGYYLKAITALRQAIEQAQQAEPVAYGTWDTMIGYGSRMMMVRLDKGQDGCTVPLYTSPPPRQPLTNEEILDVNMSTVTKLIDEPIICDTDHNIIQFARAIEAAHGIKGAA